MVSTKGTLVKQKSETYTPDKHSTHNWRRNQLELPVDRCRQPDAWASLGPTAIGDLTRVVAHLPAEVDREPAEAKQVHLLMLNTQLA